MSPWSFFLRDNFNISAGLAQWRGLAQTLHHKQNIFVHCKQSKTMHSQKNWRCKQKAKKYCVRKNMQRTGTGSKNVFVEIEGVAANISWDFETVCSGRLLIDNVFHSEQLLAGILFPLQTYNGVDYFGSNAMK